jgi:hypothetical protein
MRVFWAGFLMTGLLLIGLSVYEGQQATDEQLGIVTASEDGTPMPDPYPTPPPKKLN